MAVSSLPETPPAAPDSAAGESAHPDNDSAPVTSPGDSPALDLVLILGETLDGKKFRPSDWCDRLHGALRALGEESEEAGRYVHLVNFSGQKCVMVDHQLQELNAIAYRFFMRFADDNKLRIEHITRAHWDSLHT